MMSGAIAVLTGLTDCRMFFLRENEPLPMGAVCFPAGGSAGDVSSGPSITSVENAFRKSGEEAWIVYPALAGGCHNRLGIAMLGINQYIALVGNDHRWYHQERAC